ncbi:MAG: ATP-binding protein [Hyphomicrobiaceae bacterium]
MTVIVIPSLASLFFLLILMLAYRNHMLSDRTNAAVAISDLAQATLESRAPLSDRAALRTAIDAAGQHPGVVGIAVLARDGTVLAATGTATVAVTDRTCPECRPVEGREGIRAGVVEGDRGDVMRTVATLARGGDAASTIVVDYADGSILGNILRATLALGGAGGTVLAVAIAGIASVLHRAVLAPLARLDAATAAIAHGYLEERLPERGHDEMAALARSFNAMAAKIGDGIRSIERREANLQALIDGMPDGVRVIDADYTVLMANTAFAAQTGYARGEIVGGPCYLSSHGRDRPCAPTLVTCPLEEMRKGQSQVSCRHRHVRKDATQYYVEVSAAPLSIEVKGERRDVIVEVVRDLSQDLKVSQEQRLSEIGYLAAGVAHEIHNPLASIQFGLSAVSREIAEERFDGARTYVPVIEQQIGRCIEVTERLLKLSSPSSGEPELVVLNDVVADTLSLLSAEALGGKIEIRSAIAPDLRVIASDSDMRMLALNIAQNAFHAMPEGGVLTITGRRAGDSLEIDFADTGCGIPLEHQQRIFEPFWSRRADGAHGTGLGLPICREILKSWGGTITVESKSGSGTRFRITMPSADRQAALP